MKFSISYFLKVATPHIIQKLALTRKMKYLYRQGKYLNENKIYEGDFIRISVGQS